MVVREYIWRRNGCLKSTLPLPRVRVAVCMIRDTHSPTYHPFRTPSHHHPRDQQASGLGSHSQRPSKSTHPAPLEPTQFQMPGASVKGDTHCMALSRIAASDSGPPSQPPGSHHPGSMQFITLSQPTQGRSPYPAAPLRCCPLTEFSKGQSSHLFVCGSGS